MVADLPLCVTAVSSAVPALRADIIPLSLTERISSSELLQVRAVLLLFAGCQPGRYRSISLSASSESRKDI